MSVLEIILKLLQALLAFANICILIYAFKKFLSAPHDSRENKVSILELEIKEIKASLLQGNDRFRAQDRTNEVLIRSTLALIEFEMNYCLIEKKPVSNGLQKAKEELDAYLSVR